MEEGADGTLSVRVTAPPEEGRANDAVRDLLAKHFAVPRSAVRLLRGATSRRKTFEIG